jgi:glycosyltransferase involved in cell wall biosynthesis
MPPTLSGNEHQRPRARLISVGSLISRKGIENAIIALFELHRRLGRHCPDLDIYGEGELSEYLQEIVAILGLKDIVRFHGISVWDS